MGKIAGDLAGMERIVTTVAFSPDGQTVITGSEDRTAQLWDVKTGKPLHEPLQNQAQVTEVAFSPDGQTVLTGIGGPTFRFWDVKTGKPLHEPIKNQRGLGAVAFSPDGQTVLTSSGSTVLLWTVPPPAADEPERLRLSVEVRTGYFIDSDGVRRRLNQAQWPERRKQLDAHGGFCDIRSWDQLSEAEKKPRRTLPK
jgi:eukaryotic-like serine/threonine-protein kinase